MTVLDAEHARIIAHRFTDDLWNRGNLATAEQLLAPDFVDHDPVEGQPPGRDGFVQVVQAFRSAFPDLRVTNEDVIVEGPRVVLRWTARGTHQAPLMTVPATGRTVTLKGVDILYVHDGRVTERWGEFDALGMLRQLGVLPT